jgi:adenylate kinase family enzyme
MQRIHITGNAGSGKTTLARKLGAITGLEVHGLDAVVWQPGWKATPLERRRELERELIAPETWIIEGVSRIVRDAADTVIFLDVSPWRATWRCTKRNLPYLFRSRPGLPEDCPEIKIVWPLLRIIWKFNHLVRPTILKDFEGRNAERFFHIRNEKDLDPLIHQLRTILLETTGVENQPMSAQH